MRSSGSPCRSRARSTPARCAAQDRRGNYVIDTPRGNWLIVNTARPRSDQTLLESRDQWPWRYLRKLLIPPATDQARRNNTSPMDLRFHPSTATMAMQDPIGKTIIAARRNLARLSNDAPLDVNHGEADSVGS